MAGVDMAGIWDAVLRHARTVTQRRGAGSPPAMKARGTDLQGSAGLLAPKPWLVTGR